MLNIYDLQKLFIKTFFQNELVNYTKLKNDFDRNLFENMYSNNYFKMFYNSLYGV